MPLIRAIFTSSHREYRPVTSKVTGQSTVLPVIFTDSGVLKQFVKYMYLNRNKSRSWQDAATLSVQLLLDYMDANKNNFSKPRELFSEFSNALHSGTYHGGQDDSGLWWGPRQPDNAESIITHITRFTDWLAVVNEDAELQLNPWRDATHHEQRLSWAAHTHRRDNAFLSHLWRSSPRLDQVRTVSSRTLPIDDLTLSKSFPDDRVNQLVTDGFRRRVRDGRGAVDLRNALLTLLMHYGGLRLSEAISLWSEDVSLENGEVIVRVYHPEYGLAPDNASTRLEYLDSRFGLVPRNRLVKSKDSLFLGWKDCLITDPVRKCFEIFFFPYEAGEAFARLWRDYHLQQRVKPSCSESHPYAFTNSQGQPYSHAMFRKSHKLAVERIGLESGKQLGTTPHGHRHAYGQRMASANMPAIIIKTAMHHKAIKSSLIYTEPDSSALRRKMIELESQLSAQHSLSTFFQSENECE